ncbi:YybH family protein [Ferrimonas aestuarii]|uniref:SnoaL-like domain-containing protein n=1 Tax=Ferrimonas aestuarii TaxID=2569539 RepID=A0A4U1BMU1_9GAMM|nr:hypothetical protein [Ferrimonas aestuarii]TKB54264.1 hypothetical protein FCL42_12770 [Ferrimonas aestuarii]
MRALSLILTLLVCFSARASNEINTEINQIYAKLSVAYDNLKTDDLIQFYSDNACLISASKEEGLLNGRQQIAEGIDDWFQEIRQRGAQLKVHYRVVNRQMSADTVIDSGYYLVVYTPAKSTEQPASEFVGKYIMSFQRNQDKHWQIISESANRTKSEKFLNSPRQEELFYQEYQRSPTTRVNP